MKSKIVWALSGLIFLGGVNIPSKDYSNSVVMQETYETKEQKMDSIIGSYLKDCDVSVSVYSLDDNQFVYEYDSSDELIPASTVKLFTAAAALDKLGHDYRFLTDFYTDGVVKNGVLEGNIYVKGYGDPVLVDEKLELIVQELEDLGIEKINGDIIGDASYFDKELTPGNKENANSFDKYEPYNAKTSALSYNWNAIEFVFDSHDGKMKIGTEEPTEYVDYIASGIKLDSSTTNLKVEKFKHKDKEGFLFSGLMENDSEESLYVIVDDPASYFVKSFKSFLEEGGIEVDGEAYEGKLQGSLSLLYTHQSDNLSEIVKSMNKFSNNFIAEQLVKTLGARVNGSGSLEEGVKVVNDYASSFGVSLDIVDGSGLSINDKLSSKELVELLIENENNPYFENSLPISYTDGTLKSRMKKMKGKVKAKTGTMAFSGVSSIAGYLESKSGEEYVFSIIVNGDKSVYYVKSIETKLLKEFY